MSQHPIPPFALFPFPPPFKKLRLLGIALTLVLVLFLFCGARLLPRFLLDMSGIDPLNQVYYTTVQFFGAPIDIPRPALEARSELQKLIANGNADANLYRLLAEQDERLLDFTNAEKNFLQFVQSSKDKAESYGVLAGFYEKRLRFRDAVAILLKQVDVLPNEPSQIPIQDRQRYRILHYVITLIESRKLEKPDSLEQFKKLLQLYPEDSPVYQELLKALTTRKQHAEAVKLLERYRQKFPRDQEYALSAEAQLLEGQGNIDAALQVYSRSYQPRWSDSALNGYLGLLKRSGRFDEFVQSLGQRLKQDSTDFPSVTLLFRSTLSQGNLEAARLVLFHYRSEKESRNQGFSDDEIETLAHYFYSLNHFNEAARYFSTLALQAASSAKKEESLFQLYEVMLDAQNRPTQLGGGDLDYFKTVASLDAYPGFLNGMLSLILNRSYPGTRYEEAQERAVSYFNRARAAELLEFYEKAYPKSSRLPRMQYQSLESLKTYGRWETIAQRSAVFLRTYPESLEAPAVGILLADAYANLKNEPEELKVYSLLLQMLNTRPHRFVANPQLPPGQSPGNRSRNAVRQIDSQEDSDQTNPLPQEEQEPQGLAASQQPYAPGSEPSSSAVRDRQELETARLQAVDYSYVLERTISRLTSTRKYLDAVALFRQEIERNPNEEALYTRLAEYLNQHRFFSEEMETYQKAIDHFNKSSWYDKLARWYLRQKRQADFASLSRKFIDAFKGTEIEAYFASVVSQVRPNAFYEELNLYANRRFPHNPVFARNLSDYYYYNTRNFKKWESVAQKYFFEDKQIRDRYYAYLSWQGRLQPMLNELANFQERNLAQTRFLADAFSWQSEFEKSLPHFQSLTERYPTEPEIINLASDLLRSLGNQQSRHTVDSAMLRENLAKFNPDDQQTMTRIGETYADIEAYPVARRIWQRIPEINVSDRALHLEVATLFWDYYLFEDSLKAIQVYRTLAKDVAAMAYEAGAIYEDRKAYSKVIDEYINATALGGGVPSGVGYSRMGSESSTDFSGAAPMGGDDRAFRRLKFLALRRNLRSQIDTQFQTKIQTDTAEHNFSLAYVRYMEDLGRLDDLRKFLLGHVSVAPDSEFLSHVQHVIHQHGFYEVQEAGLKRQLDLSSTVEQKLMVEVELARFYDRRNRIDDALAVLERLHKANPKSLGLIRDLEDFYWRHQLQDRAIALLERSIPFANASYRKQFLFDQAQKLQWLKQYDRAIGLGQQLLKENPLDAQYSNFVARSLALANRQAELPAFYSEQLQAIRKSSLSSEEKKERTLAFRRGMIEAQIVLKDFAAALDQYVEMVNVSAEDTEIVHEASDFAREHQLEGRLQEYYQKTAQQSPRDHRWPLVLARMQEHWGRLNDSLQQVEAAIRIRPERADLYEIRASLQQRLLDFPAAIQTYDRLYTLSYKNARYMLKIADLQARLGRNDVAVDSLRKAFAVDDSSTAPQFFKLADQLYRWGLFDEAKPLVDEGWKRFTQHSANQFMGSNDLLKSSVEVSVARRDSENTLLALRTENSRLDGIKNQPGGNQAYSNQEIVHQALLEVGKAVDRYYTPEEKAKFQGFLEKIQPPFSLEEKRNLGVKIAEAAGLPDLQESLLISILDEQARRLTPDLNENDTQYRNTLQQLVEFYRQRQAYEKAAVSLVNLWERNPQKTRRFSDLVEPSVAARKTGNASQEMATLEKYANVSGGLYDPAVLHRYYQLLGELNQESRIVGISQKDSRMIPDLVNVLIDRNKLSLARTVIQNYGQRKNPVWTATQLAMAGAYLKDPTPQVAAAFSTVLNLKPIGQLLKTPTNPENLLYGAEWYFYARSYGEYLYFVKDRQAADYLPAQLEVAPTSEPRQSQLGQFYRTKSDLSNAAFHFDQALELDSTSVQALDGQAMTWMGQNLPQKATENWLKILDGQRTLSLPHLQLVLQRVEQFKLYAAFRQPIEDFLKGLAKQNQTYWIGRALAPALAVFRTPEEKVRLLKTVAEQTQALPFVSEVMKSSEIESSKLPLQPLFEQAIEWKRGRLKEFSGDDHSFQLNELIDFQLKYAEYLLKNKGEARAETLLAAIQENYQASREAASDISPDSVSKAIQFLRARLFSQTNRAEQAKTLLLSLCQRPAPIQSRRDDYLKAADLLKGAARVADARALRAELYQELIKSEPFINANYLGLAEVYLEVGQAVSALATLERMRLSQVDNWEGYRLSAELLLKYKSLKAEPASTATLAEKVHEVLRELIKLNPFIYEPKLQLAEALGTTNAETQSLLKSVLSARQSSYQQKAEASRIAGKTGNASSLVYSSPELRIVAEKESQKTSLRTPSTAPGESQLPLGYWGPLYASQSAKRIGPVSLDALRRSLYLRPIPAGMKDEMNSLLFTELIKGYARAQKPRLLIDLFEQYGSGTTQSLAYENEGEMVGSIFPENVDARFEEDFGQAPVFQLLASFSFTSAQKAGLLKQVIKAYSDIEDPGMAARVARAAAPISSSSREAFKQQARQMEEKARQTVQNLAARFSVSDALGEEFSKRQPVAKPKRGRVRS